jgi:hypothetical protein
MYETVRKNGLLLFRHVDPRHPTVHPGDRVEVPVVKLTVCHSFIMEAALDFMSGFKRCGRL